MNKNIKVNKFEQPMTNYDVEKMLRSVKGFKGCKAKDEFTGEIKDMKVVLSISMIVPDLEAISLAIIIVLTVIMSSTLIHTVLLVQSRLEHTFEVQVSQFPIIQPNINQLNLFFVGGIAPSTSKNVPKELVSMMY